MARLTLRIDFAGDRMLGPGKIRLLELIRETGSISAAGRSMGMSYRRAWLLVDALNRMFREPAVTTQPGGKAGGGASLTRFGEALVGDYRGMEAAMSETLRHEVARLEKALAPPGEPARPDRSA